GDRRAVGVHHARAGPRDDQANHGTGGADPDEEQAGTAGEGHRPRMPADRIAGMGKKVTVVGAGFYGSTTAQRLAEYDVFDTVVLTDIIEGRPAGLALDLNQSRAIEGFETKVVGVTTGPDGSGYEAV